MAGDEDATKLVGADRVLAVLKELAAHPEGITLDELATTLASSKPTVHRALASLRKAGLAEQRERGVYLLGDEFLRLAFRHHDERPETARIQPLLAALAARFGETAHYAVLDGFDVVYRAKVDPPAGAVRLTSVIGGRNPAYRTAVGKLLLGDAITTLDELRVWIGGRELERRTEHTLVAPEAFFADIVASRERGYGIDNQEGELGVNCLAVPIYLDGTARPSGALSLSSLTFRFPVSSLVAALPEIRSMIAEHLGG